MDPGETDYEAALRETREEAGFSDSVLEVMPDFKIELRYSVKSHLDGKHREKLSTYWLAELINPSENNAVLSDEHKDFKWLALKEAKDISGFQDFNEALEKCQAKIEKNL